jgi:glycosyltransferase involved in cell wall biosynthesis
MPTNSSKATIEVENNSKNLRINCILPQLAMSSNRNRRMDAIHLINGQKQLMKAIIITTEKFPSGDAGSIRYVNLAPCLQSLGYDLLFIGYGNSPYKKFVNFPYGKYVSLRPNFLPSFFSKIIGRIGFKKRLISFAKSQIETNDIVIMSPFFSWAQCRSFHHFCAQKHVKVIYSVVERFSSNEYPCHGLFSIEYHQCRVFYRKFRPTDGSILAISHYIGSYFQNKNVNTLIVPFVFSDNYCSNTPILSPHPKKEFLYAGTPGKKDLLLTMLQGFSLLSESDRSKIHVSVYGVGNKWLERYEKNSRIAKTISSFTTFYGRRTNEEIQNAYSNSDYSILLRDETQIFAKAGFPTKVSEALFHGVPVICNDFSDLGFFLFDGENSIQVKGHDSLSFCCAIKRTFLIDQNALSLMKSKARETAHKYLESSLYNESFRKFLSQADF